MTAVGKIHKPTLREMAATTLTQETLQSNALTTPSDLTLTVLKNGKLKLSYTTADSKTDAALKQLASALEWDTETI